MPKLAFAENEKALCFHGPLMYEAKVTKAEMRAKESDAGKDVGPHYYVHYKGWKATWDEWVPEERLKKFNEENIKKQKALIEAQRARDAAEQAALKKIEHDSMKKPGNNAGAGGHTAAGHGRREEKSRGQKRARDGEGEDEYMKRPEIKISIPDVLKVQLVDDWEAVTKNQQLVKLPRNPNVDVILEDYMKSLVSESPERRRLAAEVCAGLRLYFNKALGNNLLYRFERGQYADQLKAESADDGMSTIYGAEHLLRLFVNLPELLAHTSMDPETVAVLKENLAGFLSWMAAKKHLLFASDYDNTSSAYQNNNRG